jgi:5-methylcytosine-specific restriction endonuclease McrA
MRAARNCSTPNCSGLVYLRGSKCAACRTAAQQLQDAARPGRRTRGNYDAEYVRNRAIVLSEEDTCHLCNGPGLENDVADHVVDLVDGGTNERSNLRRAHYRCNARKAAQRGFARAHS